MGWFGRFQLNLAAVEQENEIEVDQNIEQEQEIEDSWILAFKVEQDQDAANTAVVWADQDNDATVIQANVGDVFLPFF